MLCNFKGFSLIEVMIALTVLAVGLIGLGQLQARLWVSSGERHTQGDAMLIAANRLEHSLSNFGNTTIALPPVNPGRHRFSTGLLARNNGNIKEIQVTVDWITARGKHSMRLRTSQFTAADPFETRWLLPEATLWSQRPQ